VLTALPNALAIGRFDGAAVGADVIGSRGKGFSRRH
jgi:hypothetical protein